MDLLGRIGVELPVVQAGMGGGASGGPLAGAVSAAGGLGTVGIMAPRAFAAALADARRRAGGRPVAANLLVPFTSRAHVRACVDTGAALVVLHGGLGPRLVARLRSGGVPVLVTVGTAGEARRAIEAGADGLVAQGLEAGGHLMGVAPLADALPAILDAAAGRPVLAAGGIAEAKDVRRVLAAGASAAVAGTRFLLTPESGVHEAYRGRLVDAERTLVTGLFGVGWPLRHRVIPNAATERWCAQDGAEPAWVRGISVLSAPVGRVLPLGATGALVGVQRPGIPLFSPGVPLAGMPRSAVDATALYAGETVGRLRAVIPAGDAVARLAP